MGQINSQMTTTLDGAKCLCRLNMRQFIKVRENIKFTVFQGNTKQKTNLSLTQTPKNAKNPVHSLGTLGHHTTSDW